MKVYYIVFVLVFASLCKFNAQSSTDQWIQQNLKQILITHKTFSSIPNVASNYEDMYRNVDWVDVAFKELGFQVDLLESSTLPVFLAQKTIDPNLKTILFYFHLDGQAVNPENWDQEDPFDPVLKKYNEQKEWEMIPWKSIQGEIDPEWRVFGRAAADDKGPIIMMLSALKFLKEQQEDPKFNVKILLDLQEEAGSDGFLSTLEQYKDQYAADYMIIMDGPAHPSNKPTLTFGCRGIAQFDLTVYGAKLPQHSGHYGNYSPNPIFILSELLAGMKGGDGRVKIEGYYDEVPMDKQVKELLSRVPDDENEILNGLGIAQADNVGNTYQEALQYPSLNIRHIETSWKGPGLKTVIPEYVTAHFDVRLVSETDGADQLEKIKNHIADQGFLILDREPNDEERGQYSKIARFRGDEGVNAFRTELNSEIGIKLRKVLTNAFGEEPVSIRTMGGTVPIIPAVNTLKIPAIIVPMVNMDNNQHNPNENLRIGNMIDGIKICYSILKMDI